MKCNHTSPGQSQRSQCIFHLPCLTSKFKTTAGFTAGTGFLTGEVCKHYEAFSNRRMTVLRLTFLRFKNRSLNSTTTREKGKVVLEIFPLLLNQSCLYVLLFLFLFKLLGGGGAREGARLARPECLSLFCPLGKDHLVELLFLSLRHSWPLDSDIPVVVCGCERPD